LQVQPAEIVVINPATGAEFGRVPDGGVDEVNRAVATARQCFNTREWRGRDGSGKERVLLAIADAIDRERKSLGELVSRETGKTLSEAMNGDVDGASDAFRYYAGAVRRLTGETIPIDGKFLNYTLREPVGVVGAIVPWNFPLCIAAWKVAPALACGCSVVLKPSELTPLSALRLAEIAVAAGLPAGALQVVTGYGATAGEALARHMDVNKITFTGSPATARRLLELGGKSPNIVFADADLDAAARKALWGIFHNKGEVCTAGSRLLLEASIHDAFLDKLITRAARLRVGDPLDPKTEMGSQISAVQTERVLGYIERAKLAGAELRCGGHRIGETGCFVAPTIFSAVTPEMEIAQQEVFGPVLPVLRFGSEEEAIAIANSTTYGLAAAVWTNDLRRAHRMAAALAAGVVWVNTYNGFDTATPFGGVKQSGFGRDLGAAALDQYTHVKSVWVAL
jgi:aldehyde dehydrogenase (NAD+)